MKSGKIDIEEARALVSDAALWPLVRDFLWNFAPQVHPSHLEGVEIPSIPKSLTSSPRVKRWLLEKLGVKPLFDDFPKDGVARIALLDGDVLKSISLWLGTLSLSSRLRLVTSGAEVRSLKAALPGIYPDALAFAPYFKEFSSVATDGEDVHAPAGIAAAGAAMLLSIFDDGFPALLRRVQLKLPKTMCDAAAKSGAVPPKFGSATVFKLLKLKFPEAYKLCCS